MKKSSLLLLLLLLLLRVPASSCQGDSQPAAGGCSIPAFPFSLLLTLLSLAFFFFWSSSISPPSPPLPLSCLWCLSLGRSRGCLLGVCCGGGGGRGRGGVCGREEGKGVFSPGPLSQLEISAITSPSGRPPACPFPIPLLSPPPGKKKDNGNTSSPPFLPSALHPSLG